MQTNTPNGKHFKMACGATMTRKQLLAEMTKAKAAGSTHTITAHGKFGSTSVNSDILFKSGSSLVTFTSDKPDAGITIDSFDNAIIKATHLVKTFGSANISA